LWSRCLFCRGRTTWQPPVKLLELSCEVGTSLRLNHYLAGTISIKIRDSDFKNITRSKTLSDPINNNSDIFCTAAQLYRESPFYGRFVRLVGITCRNLKSDSTDNVGLFASNKTNLDSLIDQLNIKYPNTRIVPASLLKSQN